MRNSNKSTLTVQQSLSLNGGRFENRGTVNATDGSLVITGALNNYGTDESDAVVNAKSITEAMTVLSIPDSSTKPIQK